MPTLIAGTKPIQILHFAIYTGCSFFIYIYISILTSENPHNLKTLTTPFREHLREAEAAGTGDTASKRHLLALDEAAQACPGIEKHKYLNRNPGDTKRTT